MTIENAIANTQPSPNFIPPRFDQMPAELKSLEKWVLWGSIWNGSKWTKRPIQISGYGASSTNPKHWSSFDKAKRAYERAVAQGYMELRERGKQVQHVAVGGVGFVFDGQPDPDGLVYAGVDFDKVVSGAEIASLAEERIKRLGSYTERSVSGTGLHVIVKAQPLASGIARGGVEMYTSGRFFVMTGASPANATIIAAPDAFDALAMELQAEIKSSAKASASQNAGQRPEDTWFDKLPSDRQNEVIRHAALHIAENTKLFELTKHGGNYQEYFKLALAIARSGVKDAEAIFVEAASRAKDAEPVDELRRFFQTCACSQTPTKAVTVGTLLHLARQCGCTFSKWTGAIAVELYFDPGNEPACREALDKVVAADGQAR